MDAVHIVLGQMFRGVDVFFVDMIEVSLLRLLFLLNK